MVKHIVLFNLKAGKKDESRAYVVKELESLSAKIQELDFLEIGTNFSDRKTAFDIILVSHFASKAALEIYKNHPEHVKVVQNIKPHIEKTAVCDYMA